MPVQDAFHLSAEKTKSGRDVRYGWAVVETQNKKLKRKNIMSELQALTENLKVMGEGFEGFKARYDAKLNEIETVLGRGAFGGSSSSSLGARSEIIRPLVAYLRTGIPQGAMHSEDDTAGGYTIPLEINKEILEVAKEKVTLRKLARVVIGGPDYRQIVCPSGPATGWATERSTRSETTAPELAAVNFIFGELYANIGIYNHLLEDSTFNLGSWIVEKINEACAVAENEAFLIGDSVGKPKGLLSYTFTDEADADRAWGSLQYVASGAASTLSDAGKLVDLMYSLRPGYHDGAAWIMSPSTASIVRQFKDGEGRWMWSEMSDGQPRQLLGYPVYLDEYMPSIEADAYPILFGNYQAGYSIVDHPRGLAIIRDDVTTKGLTQFYVSRRVAGAVADFHAIKALKIAAS